MQNTNSLRDEIRQEQQKLKDQPLSKKAAYFWEYYRLHVIVILLVIIVVGYFSYSILTQKDSVLSIIYVNAIPSETGEVEGAYISEFENYLGIDQAKQQVTFDSSIFLTNETPSNYAMAYEQKIFTLVAAGDLDIMVADESLFVQYASQGFFQDLSPLLTEQQLETYQDRLLYMDIPDDEISGEIAVGLSITDSPGILATESYPNTPAYFGIIANSSHLENALEYLEFLELE